MSALLEMQDGVVEMRTRRGVARVVDGVSFSVAGGRGARSGGRVRLRQDDRRLRTILGLLPANAAATGRVLFEGEDLLDLRSGALQRNRGRNISMIFQEPMTALNPLMRAAQQIGEALEINLGYSRSKAWEAAVGSHATGWHS